MHHEKWTSPCIQGPGTISCRSPHHHEDPTITILAWLPHEARASTCSWPHRHPAGPDTIRRTLRPRTLPSYSHLPGLLPQLELSLASPVESTSQPLTRVLSSRPRPLMKSSLRLHGFSSRKWPQSCRRLHQPGPDELSISLCTCLFPYAR